MFSAYSLVTKNAQSGYSTLIRFLEITEAAYKTDSIDPDKQNSAGQITVTDPGLEAETQIWDRLFINRSILLSGNI